MVSLVVWNHCLKCVNTLCSHQIQDSQFILTAEQHSEETGLDRRENSAEECLWSYSWTLGAWLCVNRPDLERLCVLSLAILFLFCSWQHQATELSSLDVAAWWQRGQPGSKQPTMEQQVCDGENRTCGLFGLFLKAREVLLEPKDMSSMTANPHSALLCSQSLDHFLVSNLTFSR